MTTLTSTSPARAVMRLLPLGFLIFFFLCSGPQLHGAVFYVRPDGGSASQCDGSLNAPYPGSGSSRPCAWDHPFRALPPGQSPRISGGDTLHVAAGSYMMGIGAPETDRCEAEGAWDCTMPPIPSGPSAATPTRILGDCTAWPELWGTERAELVVNLTGSSNVEIACFEITDHSPCVEWHSGGLACQRDAPPFGRWASRGIYAADSSNVTLRSLDIHGLSGAGIHAGRLRDWTVSDVRLAANGYAGWDGDIDGDDWNDGTMRFTRWVVEWNGCAETWPGRQPAGCWAQTAGGYGDGVGTGETRGRWIIEDSSFLHNTSDGLDLLYVRPGGSIEIRRTLARGNAGNQIKTAGPALIENAVVVGNCGWFERKAVTFDVDPCRAAGNAVAMFVFPGDSARLLSSTIISEGDCVVFAGCAEGAACNGSERVTLRNNIVIGAPELADPTDRSCALYWERLSDASIDVDYSIVYGAKGECQGLRSWCNTDPLLASGRLEDFDARLRSGSPAIGAALREMAPDVDFTGQKRDAAPDIGAFEYRAPSPRRRLARP